MARVLNVVSVHVEKKIISCHRFVSSICYFDVALQFLRYFRKNERRYEYVYEVLQKPSQTIDLIDLAKIIVPLK